MTILHKIPTTKTVEPKASKVTKFRVPINYPAPWKIQSIAELKRGIYLKKKQQDLARSLSKPNEANSAASAPPSLVRSASFGQRARSMSMDERVELIERKRNTITSEQIERELEVLHKNSNIIRGKIHSLSVVRYSLLWLLKKAILCERAEIC